MTVTKSLYVLLILAGMFYSCSYKKGDIPNPVQSMSGCVTSNITYSKTIAPIIDQYCISCHGSNTYQAGGGGYNLDGYNNMKTYSEPGGILIKSITSSSGVIPMPYGGPPLSSCDIAKIQSWINAGAPNN